MRSVTAWWGCLGRLGLIGFGKLSFDEAGMIRFDAIGWGMVRQAW